MTTVGTTLDASTRSTPASLDVEVGESHPPIVRTDGSDPAAWVHRHRSRLRATLDDYGCVVVRGCAPVDADAMSAVVDSVAGEPMHDREAFASRRRLADGVYSATTWPAGQRMCMHHEMSYSLDLPAVMVFACRIAPTDGGATPVADGAAVLDALPTDLVERVSRDGWILDRAYTGEIGSSVAESFGTDDHDAVESYCRAHHIEFSWRSGVLHTSQRRPGVVRHPVTGRSIWFNQLAFLSEWTMDADVREFLIEVCGADSLPFTTRYGNGDPVDAATVDTIGAVYDAHTRREPWQPGDLLLVDNIRTAHGRDPYTGPREVVVGMGQPMRHAGSEATA